ncbi:ABC transporter ATP-binding protein [Rhizobium sp. LEGMi135b]
MTSAKPSPQQDPASRNVQHSRQWTLSACDVTKRYGNVVANGDVSLELRGGEVHALLGENGAGKSTIMKILYGMVIPDEGHVELDGRPLLLASPKDAIAAGIGMVFQHFMLVPTLTVLENLTLGTNLAGNFLLSRSKAREKLNEIARRYRINVDLNRRVAGLSVGEQQRVEILKALVRGARALILDEPTAVLTPSEIDDLCATLRELALEGHGIIIVTHKLPEVMKISDRVTVMRQGRVTGTWRTCETSSEELVLQMIGRDVHEVQVASVRDLGPIVLEMRDVVAANDRGLPALNGLSMSLRAGEIVGIAGVEGNGQNELAECLTGIRQLDRGEILLNGVSIRGRPTCELIEAGIGHVPEDRHRDAAILDFSLVENAILVDHSNHQFQRFGLVDWKKAATFTEWLITDFAIRCAGPGAVFRELSGGNQQKLVMGRELARAPKLLIAMQPTRGLDLGAIEYVHNRLVEQRAAGTAIVLISTELEEILALSDRILILRNGRLNGSLERHEASKTAIGDLMLGQSEVVS